MPRLIPVRVIANPLTESVIRKRKEDIASVRAAVIGQGRDPGEITVEAATAATTARADIDVQTAEIIVRVAAATTTARADIDVQAVEIIVRVAIAHRAEDIPRADIQPVDTESPRFTDATEMRLISLLEPAAVQSLAR